MSWQTILTNRVSRELKKHGVQEWLLHLDRLDIRRLEAALDGTSCHHGESTCLSLALWSSGRVFTLSLLVMPDRIQKIPERVTAAIEGLSAAVDQSLEQSAPGWHEGFWSSWEGDWNSLTDRWRPQLLKSIGGEGTGGFAAQQLTLYLERRELRLQDHKGRTRQVTRYANRVAIFCRQGPDGNGTWTMTVPLKNPEPHNLAPHIKRAIRHAQVRTCRRASDSGVGNILLQPTAVAQLLDAVQASAQSRGGPGEKFLPAVIVQRPPAYRDDLGFRVNSRAREANSGFMRFAHQAALPVTDFSQLWIAPGKGASQRAKPRGLTIWHLDEVLWRRAPDRLVMIASGEIVTRTGSCDVSGVRLDISWSAIEEALLNAERRGRSVLAIQFGETDYHVPALSLGEFSWAAQ